VVYGEDPSEGFARGRRFLHPKLGFTFLAPPGFSLDNTAQAVLGLKDGNEAMRLDVVSVPAEQSLPDYLKSGWIEHVDSTSVEEFTVNGFTAYSPCVSAVTSIASFSRRKTRRHRSTARSASRLQRSAA
jgi:predicted Zn-dependent protease